LGIDLALLLEKEEEPLTPDPPKSPEEVPQERPKKPPTTWMAKVVYFDRYRRVWQKPQYLTVQAASFQTALHRAGQMYKKEYLGRSDMYRLGQVQVTLSKQREPGESF
jgi:hypothetical protein